MGFKPEQQVEDALCVAIDEGGCHTDHLIGDACQLCHSLSLSAFTGILVQLIDDETVDPAYLLFDVRRQREPVKSSGGREYAFGVMHHLSDLFLCGRRFADLVFLPGKLPVDKAITTDPHPFVTLRGKVFGVKHRPQDLVALGILATVIFAVFIEEEMSIRLHSAMHRVGDKLHLLNVTAVWAGKAFPHRIPENTGLTHIAVTGCFLGQNTVHGFVLLLIVGVECIYLCHRGYVPGIAVGDSLVDLPNPLAGNVRGADDHIKCLVIYPPFGITVLISIQCCRTDLCLTGTALCHQQSHFVGL